MPPTSQPGPSSPQPPRPRPTFDTAGVERLVDEFRGVFGRETIDQLVAESLARLRVTATIESHLPVLAHRFTRERLRALAQAEDLMPKTQAEVLFVCVHNAGRSQMAAALTTELSGGRVGVRSAGSAPASDINATAREAMAEIGVDLDDAFPKPLTDEVVRAADVVITMGCGDACPLYPGRRYLDWEVADPAGQPIEVVRAIREDLRARVTGLLTELGVTPVGAGARECGATPRGRRCPPLGARRACG